MKLQEKRTRSETTILRNHFEFMPGISVMEILELLFCIRQILEKFNEWAKKSNFCMEFINLDKTIGINQRE